MLRILKVIIISSVLCITAAKAATISISCGAVGKELDLCKSAAQEWASKTNNEVNVISTPNSATERLALYQQILAAGATDIDVFQIDVIWPGILATHLLDLKPYTNGEESEHFNAIVENNTVDGKLVAMPWYTDAGVLYYRKDLLEKYGAAVPTTWQELTATAQKIQDAEREAGKDKMWGYVWQGKAYEGLTCNALEWITSFNGGSIVEADGTISIDNENAIKAIDMAAGWVGTITPKGVLNYAEEEARGVFQSGNAVFMRNWPYAWALSQGDGSAVKDKVGVSALPKGGEQGRNAATLGGWQLAVSKYSENPDAAAELVAYIAGDAIQKSRAIDGSYNPTIGALYSDQDILDATPFFGELYSTFTSAVPRPSTVTSAKYNQVSNEFWNAVYDTLAGKQDAATSMAKLKKKLTRLSRGGKW